jgi:group I intron endonuclease
MQGIYKITNPKGKTYIGLSTDIETRWESYRYYTGMSKNSSIKSSLKKYGYDAHTFEILEEVKGDAKRLRDRERYWIDKYNTLNEGLNDNRGGCGTLNHTEESKQKISEANSKPKPADFGANRSKDFYTDEWKQKISESNKGRTSPMKGKVGPNKGKVMSEEQKRKISEALRGRPKNFKKKPPGRPKQKA